MVEIRGRDIEVILYLLAQKYPVSPSKISKEIDVNINTLRKDIPQFRKFLEENGLSLIAKPKIGLRIDGPPEKKENLREKLNSLGNRILPRKRRIWYIAESFLSEERIPTIEDLCETLDISRPTTLKYIREVKEWLSKKGIEVFGKPGFGYYIKGDEEDIRDATIDSIKNFLEFEFQTAALEFSQGNLRHNLLGVFENTNLDAIEKCIDEVQTHIKKRFVDEDLLNLAISLAVSIKRIKRDHKINLETKRITEILSNPISPIVGSSISSLKDQSQVRFTDDEISYLTLKFIGSRTQDVEGTRGFTTTSQFKRIAEEIAQLAGRLLGLPIDKEGEFVSMLAHHLESTITKIKMGVKIENPILEMVKKEYPIAYAIAERASKMIKDRFHLEMPDEEKGYIAMYIAASLEKIKQPTKRKVVVICPMGVATSKLLYYKLTNEIPEIEIVQVGSIKELEEGEIQQIVDLIISTVPLSGVKGVKIPYAVVSPFLRTEDRKLIKEILKIRKGELTSDIAEEGVFDERLIFLQISVNSSREVIKLLGNVLIKNGFAKDGLVEDILSREKKFPTGINTDIPIAIPHTSPEFTIKKGLAIATLKNPVKFREMGNPQKSLDVRIVITPVLTGKEEDGKEFYEVIQKLRDYKVANELLQCYSPQTIEKVFIK
ncbi:BglG family transcription antiterminator [Candidatus Cryosericum septentrionale]|jgi:transcriptional antiterminator|uniref:Transcription antiterminator n=1 Tax=Candidatus Cryosericum septentrionale TaxID=2290913 RepID=A0A398DM72_9BACT|nr:BglG family transcription antiterminator [Candidatus Cryosericum septentrionale]RIE16275.1 transcription antiterminator [Candidatus Cryosericum septentrionale]